MARIFPGQRPAFRFTSAVLSQEEFFERQSKAQGELLSHSLARGLQPGELLPKRWRQLVVEQIRHWVEPKPRQRHSHYWNQILELGADAPATLGFIEAPPGGLPVLVVEKFDLQRGTAGPMNKRLWRWQAAGFLELAYGPKATHHPPLVGIVVPWMTETLLTLADIGTLWRTDDNNLPREVEDLIKAAAVVRRPVKVVRTRQEARAELQRLQGDYGSG